MGSQWKFDILFYTPNEHHPEHSCNADYYYKFCWNNTDNPDVGFHKALFAKIHDNSLVQGVKLDSSRMGMVGYSTGAQMVSRAINNYPYLQTAAGVPFPEIKAALIIAGGSYHCYSYDDLDKEPPNYLPCPFGNKVGCCPTNETESVYDYGKRDWNLHPPTLLLQAKNDCYAAWDASKHYYSIMSSNS